MLKRNKGDNWKPRYGNDSRPWLVNAGDCGPKVTTLSEEFAPVPVETRNVEGIRRTLLRQFFWQEMSEEIFKELTSNEFEAGKDMSEYKNSFKVEGYADAPAVKTDPEFHRKYPLYTDTPRTLWYEKFSSLPGTTTAPNKLPRDVFRRTRSITKPIYEAD